MKISEVENPVSSLSGVGPAKAKLFSALDIFTVADLLTFYPKDWEDRTKRTSLSEYQLHKKIHTIAQVKGHSWFGYGRMRTLKVEITDDTATAELVAFNRPFLEKTLPIGAIIAVTGSFSVRYGKLQSSSFDAELVAKEGELSTYAKVQVPGSAVVPIYPLTAGLTNLQMRKSVGKAIQEYARGIEDEIPQEIIQKRGLMHKQDAIIAMHRPSSMQQALEAKRTLIYEELFHFQLAIAKRALQHKGKLPEAETEDRTNFKFTKENEQEFIENLSPRQAQLLERIPFELTQDQKQCIAQVNKDLDCAEKGTINPTKTPYTMARLVQGDVGSGKTLAAFFACLRTIDLGGQCALMAPTELLARQHAENAANILQGTGARLAFLTGNLKASGRGPLLNALASGEIDIVIGTHALFSKNVKFKNLRLVVIDEQHRFGVVQRNAILEKGRQLVSSSKDIYTVPSLLMLSATPIPRTLALTAFGDLDISTIKTMPAGRLPIKTYLTRMGNESNVYEFVRNQLKAGHQAYFVYPLIEDMNQETKDLPQEKPETLDFQNEDAISACGIKSAEDMFVFLSQQVYPEFKVALIHSRTEETRQPQILEDFRNGKVDVLVATSVVEVGVDVANATCMVIEHADRFGLAALHQLRGRVGRGSSQSHCFLIYGKNLTETGKARMKTLRETTDGFIIAEQDLKLRGPGEVTGIQQSGYLTLGIADPIRDRELLELARTDAFGQLAQQMSKTNQAT